MKIKKYTKNFISLFTVVVLLSLSACSDKNVSSKGEASEMNSNNSSAIQSTLPDNHENVPPALTVGDPDFKPGTYYTSKYPVFEFRKKDDSKPFATWWWFLHRIVAPDENGVSVDMALDMLIANNVNEIYLDIGAMVPWEIEYEQGGLAESDDANNLVSELAVRGFVKKCNKYGIRVAALGGSSLDEVVTWLDPQYKMVHMKNLISKVEAYNANCAEDEKFYGVHLDVEPFTESKYGENRELRNQWTADLILAASDECKRIGVELGWDIWAWTDAEKDMVTDRDGKKVNILELYTRECSTLCIMAYTNTAEAQYDRGTDLELQYAKKNNCTLIVASELTKCTPASTTYYFSTLNHTLENCKKLRSIIDNGEYQNMGGAMHHLGSFWQFMTKERK